MKICYIINWKKYLIRYFVVLQGRSQNGLNFTGFDYGFKQLLNFPGSDYGVEKR